MSFKILLGEFVAFFAGQIAVEGHKNIIDSLQQLIVSPKNLKPKLHGRSENFVSA
jgi:hypothetical protein